MRRIATFDMTRTDDGWSASCREESIHTQGADGEPAMPKIVEACLCHFGEAGGPTMLRVYDLGAVLTMRGWREWAKSVGL